MRKVKRIFTVVMIIALMAANLSGGTIANASEGSGNLSIIFAETVSDIQGKPGESVHVKLPVKTSGGSYSIIEQPRVTVATEGKPYAVSNIKITADENAIVKDGYIGYVKSFIEFDLKVKETAKIGTTKLEVTVDGSYYNADAGKYDAVSLALPKLNFIISDEIEPAQLTVDNIDYGNAVIGKSIDLTFTIKNEGKITARNAYFSIDDKSFEDAKIAPGYSKLEQKIGNSGVLKGGDTYSASLPLKIQKDATAGLKKLTVNMKYKDEDGNSFTGSSQIYITVTANSNAPVIEIVSTKYASELVAGDKFNLVATIHNTGKSIANNIKVTIEGLGSEGFLPGYTGKSFPVKNLAVNGKSDVKIPLIVSEMAKVGLKEVPVTFTYEDESGTEYTAKTTLYLEVETAEGVDAEGKPNIVITNVSQSPDAPNAGARVDVSFDIENKSKLDISDIKISLPAATGTAAFAPLSSEPYYYIDSIKGGKKVKVSMSFMAGETIPEGTNSLTLQYSFVANGKTYTGDSATLYILNVQNSGVGSSKPKLIISDFSTSTEELRAGSTFDFVFDIKNTHSSINARNIKVTINQTDNIFSMDKGSNTFYISSIGAGEAVQNKLTLRVKSDAVTKAYPLEITMDYDYEGAEANPTTGQIGETAKEIINLQAVENSRPVVDNIAVGSWDGAFVNQATTLTFDFYNMGKSPLNNVRASVSGDFTLSTGDNLYIGNVEAGGQEMGEMEVIPAIEGQAKGVLTVIFEDSTGQEVTLTKDFEGTIQGVYMPDPGTNPIPDGGVIDTAKSPILPPWLFIIIQCVVLVAGIVGARKIKIGLYKKKLRKLEEAE